MKYFINGNAVAVGSITSGSLKPEVLIPAFANEIKRLSTTRPKIVFEAECWIEGPKSYYDNILVDSVEPDNGSIKDYYESYHEVYASSIMYDLSCYLESMAPSGLMFCNHPGDGADFGWWENEE